MERVGPERRDRGELLQVVYDELHRLARGALAREPRHHTLQTTALLNEAWLRLDRAGGSCWSDREHFLAVAATAMRSVLVDHARRRNAEKRGGSFQRIDLDGLVEQLESRSTDLLALDDALQDLTNNEPQLAQIVDMRFFGGMNLPDIARTLGLSLRSVERSWSSARAWLHTRLSEPR